MKRLAVMMLLALSTLSAWAVQETFTSAGPRHCRQGLCTQSTTDGLFQLSFPAAKPRSKPTVSGFDVRGGWLEIRAAQGGHLDASILAAAITESLTWNGTHFIGALALDTQDDAGVWTWRAQWSSYVGDPRGIYVIFNGQNGQQPLIKGVKAVRLSGLNGTTRFTLGMMNLSPAP